MLFVPSDKTTNVYEVNKQDYKKLLLDNVTASYQKIKPSTIDKINLEPKSSQQNSIWTTELKHFLNAILSFPWRITNQIFKQPKMQTYKPHQIWNR